VVWGPGGGRGRNAAAAPTGSFTARLSVNGKSYSQQFTVSPDPRTIGR
jgi:hypothetical protein